MSCVQLFAVPAVPVPDERSWQSHTLLESAEFVERMPERLNKVADLVATQFGL